MRVRPAINQNIPFWRDSTVRSLVFQVVALCGLFLACYLLFTNTFAALAKQNVATGFDFLQQESAFGIGDTLVAYSAESSFGRALYVGLLNTLMVIVLGNLLAVSLGTAIGIARLSDNWLLAKLSKVYVDTLRNVPLLLQLFFWYALITEILPSVRNAITLVPNTFISQRGIALPFPESNPVYTLMAVLFALGVVASFLLHRFQKRRQQQTGKTFPMLRVAGFLMIGIPAIAWIIGGAPVALNVPKLTGFNFQGGFTLTPEFLALLLGLVLYTASFIAEIVRSGIQAVDIGQREAAMSLGLRPGLVLQLIILPQATRVIIPPLTSQLLNLTKNSSLAVAIGFPDFVNVANTTMNQTGQTLECIGLIMLLYLTFSLLTSLFMNWYNHSRQLAVR